MPTAGTRATRRALANLLAEVRSCQACARHLPHPPKPVLRASTTARLLIIGQAPGTRVHATGIPWNDPSGDRLREWMGISRDIFYDESRIAIMPMGFCYPGKGRSGDLPPRPECAPLWHEKLRALMPQLELVLLVGQYAQHYYLRTNGQTLGETVRNFRGYGPRFLPLPHPSPRNQLWLKRHPWFAEKVLPALKRRVRRLLKAPT